MEDVTIWHNPRCSKSRASMEILRARGVAPRVVEYLEAPPSAAEIREVLGMLGLSPRALMRTNEAEYSELGLDGVEDETALIQAMVEHPILIQRPIVIRDGRAVIGRPPEEVVSLLE